MKTLYLIFSHQLTTEQQQDARDYELQHPCRNLLGINRQFEKQIKQKK